MRPGDVPKTHSDVTDLVNDLGYKPDTTIQKRIDKFIKWYMSTPDSYRELNSPAPPVL